MRKEKLTYYFSVEGYFCKSIYIKPFAVLDKQPNQARCMSFPCEGWQAMVGEVE